MVFYCRCFSVEDKENEEETETRTQAKSTTTTYYTAASDFVPNSHVKPSEISNLAEKPNFVLPRLEEGTETFATATSDLNPIPYKAKLSKILNLDDRTSNLRVFTVAELETGTDNFSKVLNTEEGGLSTYYKGLVKSLEHPFDQIQVAVKIPTIFLQGQKEWETVVNVLGVVEHPNIVKLIGYCVDKNELLLVYEYMVNGSLRDHLSSLTRTPLSWAMRLKVVQDVAIGLTYLHEQKIIVGDLNPSNILLDDQWNAKLSDFGWAELRPQKGGSLVWTTYTGLGIERYVAPEGPLTSKSDVWSYGVFLYELITGRRALETHRPSNKQKLLEWVNPYLESQRFNQIVDPRLQGNYQLESAEKLSIIANQCLSANPESRPKMSEVLEIVNQLIMVPSQDASLASPQVPQVASDPNNKPSCLPRICPLKPLKSCFKKGCCVS